MINVNGVLMDGSTVVDIDRSQKEIVIPEYADDTTYMLTLGGIECLTINSLLLLSKFIGMPKKLILNDTTDLMYSSYHFYNLIDQIFSRPGLEWIELTEENPYYKTIDGILYLKSGITLVKCPFGRCGDIVIPEGTMIIDVDAFWQAKITSVTFPDSLRVLRERAFGECKNLEKVNFGKGITEIGSTNSISVFESCSSLKKIEFPEQVKSIGSRAFYNCKLEEVIFHEGLERIRQSAFLYNKNLKSVTLPASLEYVGTYNFYNAEDIYLSGNMPSNLLDAITLSIISMRNEEFQAITLHLHGKAICIPKILSVGGKSKVSEIIRSNNEMLFGNTFDASNFAPSRQDAALATYLFCIPNENTKKYLKEQANDMAVRYLNFGNIKYLIKLLETDFVTLDTLNALIDMMQEDDVRYMVTTEREPVVMAYIMQAAKRQGKESEKEIAKRFSLD